MEREAQKHMFYETLSVWFALLFDLFLHISKLLTLLYSLLFSEISLVWKGVSLINFALVYINQA